MTTDKSQVWNTEWVALVASIGFVDGGPQPEHGRQRRQVDVAEFPLRRLARARRAPT